MPISAVERGFPQRPLSLRGEDWKFAVDRQGTLRDYSIEKKGDTITIDFPFITRDMTIKVGDDRIDIKAFNRRDDITLEQEGEKVTITRDVGNSWTVIEREGNEIIVRHRDPTKEIRYRKEGDSLTVDRFGGTEQDVTLRVDEDGVLHVDKRGTANDVAFTVDGVALDPVTFKQDTTMDPEAWDLVWKWFDSGVKMDDLVSLTQDGKVDVKDWLFA